MKQIFGRRREISQGELQEHSNNQDGDTDGDILEVLPGEMLESDDSNFPKCRDKKSKKYRTIGASPVSSDQPGSHQEQRQWNPELVDRNPDSVRIIGVII